MDAKKPKVSKAVLVRILKELWDKSKGLPRDKFTNITLEFIGNDISDFEAENKIFIRLKKRKEVRDFKFKCTYKEIDAEQICFANVSCSFKPRKIMDLLIEMLIIPKFILSMDTDRVLVLNGEYHITRTNFNRPNYYLVNTMLKNPEIINRSDIEKRLGKSDGTIRNFHSMLDDLKFSGELRKLFFPHVSNDTLMFRNNIFLNQLEIFEIDTKMLNKKLKILKKYKA